MGGLAVSCKHSEPTPANLAVDHRQQEHAKDSARRWFTTNLAGAYERVGQHDPQWDGFAKSALNLMAAGRSGEAKLTTEWSRDVSSLAQSAVDHGCTDPLVRYVAVRYRVGDLRKADAKSARELLEIALKMEPSEYTSFLKFSASLHAAEALRAVLDEKAPPPADLEQIYSQRRNALAHLVAAFKDKTIPEDEIYALSRGLLDAIQQNQEQFPEFWNQIDQALKENWPKSARADLLRGWFYVTYAWKARGNSFADKVTPEGWKFFEERMKLAEWALLSAWEEDHTDSRIPTEMIEVCLGLGSSSSEMERWFQRAMEIAPNNLRACRGKLNYLKPVWHGSAEAMLDFGRECVRNTNWSGTVPLTLMDAHTYLSNYRHPSKAEEQEYWLQPEVWPDLKSVYEEILRRYPTDISWHHNYAWFAHKCQAWDELNEQLRLLGPVNYEYFGSQAAFNQIVEDAKKHAKP